jgi:hypothetical protein
MKARVYDEVDVTDWIGRQVRAGCIRLNLQSHDGALERPVSEWPLSAATDAAGLTEEIREALGRAREASRGFMVFALFSYRPERWKYVDVAVFFEERPQ